MRRTALVALLAAFLITALGPGFTSAGQAAPAGQDKELSAMLENFSEFAKRKLVALGQNHHMSKLRMQIVRQPDGTYRARYHSIDEQSLKCKVRRSKSKTVPFVGVLTFHEKVLEAVAASPEACRQAQFSVVQVIPNRHIYSYKQDRWQ